MKPNLYMYSFVICAFGIVAKNYCQFKVTKIYSCFLYKSFIVLALTSKSMVHFELIVLCVVR